MDDDIIAELRRQIAEARTRMTPEIIAKLLVDNEQLTRFQAAKLIGKLRDSDAGSENGSPSEKGSKSSEDDLGLLPEQETRKEESTEMQPSLSMTKRIPVLSKWNRWKSKLSK